MPLIRSELTPVFFKPMPSRENPAEPASFPPTDDNAVAAPVLFKFPFPFTPAIDEFFSFSVPVKESDDGDVNDGTEERDRDLVVRFLTEDGGDKVRNLVTTEGCSIEIEPEEVDLWVPIALSL